MRILVVLLSGPLLAVAAAAVLGDALWRPLEQRRTLRVLRAARRARDARPASYRVVMVRGLLSPSELVVQHTVRTMLTVGVALRAAALLP